MSGFWAAAERVRSGAAADAAPRPLSRFETEFEGDAPEVEAAEDKAPSPVYRAVAGTSELAVDRPADARPQQPDLPQVPQAIETAPSAPTYAEDRPATPVSPAAAALAAAELPQPIPTLVPPVVSERVERIIEQVALAPLPVSAIPSVAAPSERAPVPDVQAVLSAPPTAAAAVPPPPIVIAQPAVLKADIAEAVSRIEAPASEPLLIQIDRIEIRIDAPAAPAPAVQAARRAPVVDLNDYLARKTR